jgi:hypothetical protein
VTGDGGDREEERGVRRPRDDGADEQRGRPGAVAGDQGGEEDRQCSGEQRGAERHQPLADRDAVAVHRLREQVDDRAVVDLGAEDRGRREDRDERQHERVAEVGQHLVGRVPVDQRRDQRDQADEQHREGQQQEEAASAQQCLQGELGNGRVDHRATR